MANYFNTLNLRQQLAQLGKYLGVLAIVACVIVFIVGVLNGIPVLDIFMTAVSLAVSAIPEGLPAIVTIVLSIGVQRMAKKHAIIRRLPAVETLGSASVICSDKTGTLTQNRMTLVEAYLDEGHQRETISKENSPALRRLLAWGTLCSDGSITISDEGVQHIGDPTETSIIYAAYQNGMEQKQLQQTYPRLAEIPFDSDRKRMSSIHRIDGRLIVIVKGAFDMMVPRCIHGDLAMAKQVNEEMSARALRVLALAYKELDAIPDPLTSETLEYDLTLVGLMGMIDPPRPEAKEAVRICQQAGIRPVMITGDHVITASAIARELGILREGDRAITGVKLDAMSEEELDASVEQISVYARVSPENKIRIVKAWQRKGQIVAMTGDGVNDAPALKQADIGIAMGITGTEVSKDAATMILTDDNFATIIKAVATGRNIYANIRNAIVYLLSGNLSGIITVLVATLAAWPLPFLPVHLLFINLITDSLPALAIGMERSSGDVLKDKPRDPSAGILNASTIRTLGMQGILIAIVTIIAFVLGMGVNDATAQTMAFAVLCLSRLFHGFNCRSEYSLKHIGLTSNRYSIAAFFAGAALLAIILLVPQLHTLFSVTVLNAQQLLTIVGLAVIPTIIIQITKMIREASAR